MTGPTRTRLAVMTPAPARAPTAPRPAPAPAPAPVPAPAARRRRARRRGRRLEVMAAALVAVAYLVGAYRYTLTLLLRGVATEPTLAWLVVVLPLAALLAAYHARPGSQEPAIHDRQLDYLVGVPLLVAALAVVVLLPRQLSTLFWTYRIDVLALPLHAAGLVALLFGTRALWRLRSVIGLLAVAWPAPWLLLTDAWAERAPSSGALTVATALCFPVVAGVLLTLSAGRRRGKAAWLIAGTAVAIGAATFGGGAFLAERPVAVETLVLPVVAVTAVLMLLALPVFRLRLSAPSLTAGAPAVAGGSPAVRSLALPLIIVTLASVTVAQADWRLGRYASVAGPLGEPLTTAFVTEPPVLPGWAAVPDEGASGPPEQERSTFRYEPTAQPPAGLTPPAGAAPLLRVVVISATTQPSGRAERPVDPSISILSGGRTVELGHGVMADVVSYLDRDTGAVAFTATWSLPVRDTRGSRFERIALSGEAPDGRHAHTAPIQDFVERAAREILRAQVARAGTGPTSPGVPA